MKRESQFTLEWYPPCSPSARKVGKKTSKKYLNLIIVSKLYSFPRRERTKTKKCRFKKGSVLPSQLPVKRNEVSFFSE